MNNRHLELYRKEVVELLNMKLIKKKSYSPWACLAFLLKNIAEIDRVTSRLVINHKPLNKVLRWICYPIPNEINLLKRLDRAKVFFKFDMKSSYRQIQIIKKD